MRSNNATTLFGFILVLLAFGTNLRAETNWLSWANHLAQDYIEAVDSLETASKRTAHSSSRFVNSQWQTEAESEDRLNRLVEKLISEEYSPYDIDTCIEQEFVAQVGDSSKRQLASKRKTGTEQSIVAFSPMEYLRLGNDWMARFDSEYRDLVRRSTHQAFAPIQSSFEIANAIIRFNTSENEMKSEAHDEALEQPLDTNLAKIFGISVIPACDLTGKSTQAETATAMWEEARLLAICPHTVPRMAGIKLPTAQVENFETRISKGSFESLR